MFPPFIVCHSFYHSCQVPCYCQRRLTNGLYESINHVLHCYYENVVWICYKCSSDCFMQCPVCTVTAENKSMSFMAMSHRGVTTVKYVSTLKGILYLLKEGTSFFDTPGSSSKWVDRPVPSLCRGPLPVPTITGPRFCIFFFSYPHVNITQLTAAYIRITVYGKLSFSLNTATLLLCIQDKQYHVHITDTLRVL